MKILALIFGCVANIALAQEVVILNKTMKCAEATAVMGSFINNYGEQPVWVGTTNNQTHITLLVNKEKKTWTVVEYDSNLACVLGAGESTSNTETIDKNNL